MEKFKNPKMIAAIIGVLLGIAMAAFAPVKEVAVAVCEKITAENPVEAVPKLPPPSDLK